MTREVYYVVHASSEENQNGIFHGLRTPIKTLELARQIAAQTKDDFVVITKHREVFERHEWLPNWDYGNSWSEVVE